MKILVTIIFFGFLTQLNAQPSFVWGKQFGTDQADAGQDIVTYDSGDFVLAGSTSGNLFSKNRGGRDGFIMKFDCLGNEIWKKQFGSNKDDRPQVLKKDAIGNLYVAGTTKGIINGEGYGKQDIFVCKYDIDGILIKTKVIGTDSLDDLSDIIVDEYFNIYIAGNTKGKLGKRSFGDRDFFIMKLDSSFSELYSHQFGSKEWDACSDLTIDKVGNLYVSGYTKDKLGEENFGGFDAFVAKYSQRGELLKMKQFGTEQTDAVNNILVDYNNNIYISGTSHGNIVSDNYGKSDAFLMKLNSDCDIIWELQFGTSSWDEAWYMELINSETEIVLSGSSNPDAFVRLYDTQGNLKWNQVFAAKGIKAGTGGRNFTIFQNRYIYFTGFTFADLFSKNPNQNEDDVFIVKLKMNETFPSLEYTLPCHTGKTHKP
jgi:hypothetical protein